MSTGTSSRSRSVWFPALNTAELHDEEVPAPQGREVQVRALYSLISRGSELNFFRGEADAATRSNAVFIGGLGGEDPFPVKFAYQVVGVVEAAGPASGRSAGEVVFAVHPHQELFTLDTALVTAVPSGLAPRSAALTTMCSVALNGIIDAPVRPGECVVVFGLGVIGMFAGLLSRRVAGRLILVDPIESRRAAAGFIGADAVVHPDDVAATVARLSDGRGADVVYELSGAPPALQACLAVAGLEATVCVLSYYGTKTIPLVLSPEFHNRRLRLVSSQVTVVGQQPRWTAARLTSAAMEILADLDIEAMISHEFPFEQAPQAYQLLADKPNETQGVLLVY